MIFQSTKNGKFLQIDDHTCVYSCHCGRPLYGQALSKYEFVMKSIQEKRLFLKIITRLIGYII